MTPNRPGESQSQADLRKRLEQIRNDATSLSGTASRIAEKINETLDKGGQLKDYDQMVHFITGAYARMLQDFGAVTHLQRNHNVHVRRPPPIR